MLANTPSIQTTEGDIDALSPGAKVRYVQNVGTNPLFVLCGTGASSTVFHFVVAGGTADSDGKGGLLRVAESEWAGILSVAGTSPKYVLTELS